MNFEFGGTVHILDKCENNTWFLVKKFGYIAYIVDDDIVAMKDAGGWGLVMISLKRKVQWYKADFERPNLEQFKKRILK